MKLGPNAVMIRVSILVVAGQYPNTVSRGSYIEYGGLGILDSYP